MAEAKRQGVSNDLMSIDSLRPVLIDPNLLKIAKALLGEQLVYYGETALNYEAEAGKITNNPFRVLHADARGTPNDVNKTWDPKPGQIYRGYRFGIYFRDYTRYSGGLKVAPGSHVVGQAAFKKPFGGLRKFFGKKVSLNGAGTIPLPGFELYDLESEPGDLVIFSLRVFHSAGAARLKDNPALALHPEIENDLWTSRPDLFHPYPPGPRNTMFFDYAAPGEEIDLYIKWRAWRAYKAKADEADYYAFDKDGVVQEAAAHGITMRFDKIIAAAAVRGGQETRLQALKARNKEYSEHHSVAELN
ncbi:MAG: phytanoyl-CoA dioxygenase family protein [Xanthobacteraceae bacterium]|nr:phytanoyl-CoA dioxygenase family protein [Xanthobacteraceae bacterium]